MRREKIPLTDYVFASTKTSMNCEFDPAKDKLNIAKHGVSLEFGSLVFRRCAFGPGIGPAH